MGAGPHLQRGEERVPEKSYPQHFSAFQGAQIAERVSDARGRGADINDCRPERGWKEAHRRPGEGARSRPRTSALPLEDDGTDDLHDAGVGGGRTGRAWIVG